MDRNCDGCGVPIRDSLCCRACIQRIRAARGDKVETYAVTFTVIADSIESAKGVAMEVLGAHVRAGLDYSVRKADDTAPAVERLEPMNCDAHL